MKISKMRGFGATRYVRFYGQNEPNSLRPIPRWWELTALPDLLAVCKGPISIRGGRRRKGKDDVMGRYRGEMKEDLGEYLATRKLCRGAAYGQ